MRTIAALLAAFPLLAVAQTDEPVPPPAPPAYAPPAYVPPAYVPPAPSYAPPPQGAAPATPQYYARPAKSRDRWYIGFGIGGGRGSVERGGTSLSMAEYGHMIGFTKDPVTVSMNFKVGATLTPRLLVGLDITALRSQLSEYGVDFGAQITNYDAVVTFFPMEKGLFLRGGAGLSRFNWDASGSGTSESDSTVGMNLLGGVGYAFWLGQQFNLTVNLDFTAASYGTQNDYYGFLPESSRYWSLGVGCDWY